MTKTPTEQRPQECEYCVDNHCQHPYYNDCDCASWSWCDYFTPKSRKMENKQTPSECKYFDGLNFRFSDYCNNAKRARKNDGICDFGACRHLCPDYEPKKKKDNEGKRYS